MNRLIRADLKRITAKPGLYIFVILLFLAIVLSRPDETSAAQIEYYKLMLNVIGLTLLCIPIYLSVYSDEIKSGIMISVIGMGVERKKIVLAKLKDVFFLLLGSYMILFLAILIKNSTIDLVITPRQNGMIFVFCLLCIMRGLGIMALSSLVLFLTMSASGGMLILILTGFSASLILEGLQDYTSFPVYDYSYIGLLDSAYAEITGGVFKGSIILALIYLAAVVTVNIMIFERKEMDL